MTIVLLVILLIIAFYFGSFYGYGTGYKSCTQCAPCVQEPCNCPKIGDDYYGLDYDTKTGISIADCSKACENDSKCKVWGYNTKDRKCYLKQGISTDIVKAPDMVSYIAREYFS